MKRYQNIGKKSSALASIELKDVSFKVEGETIVCKFTRKKFDSTDINFFDLRNYLHLIVAYGPLDEKNEIKVHTGTSTSDSPINFNVHYDRIVDSDDAASILAKTHGWSFFFM